MFLHALWSRSDTGRDPKHLSPKATPIPLRTLTLQKSSKSRGGLCQCPAPSRGRQAGLVPDGINLTIPLATKSFDPGEITIITSRLKRSQGDGLGSRVSCAQVEIVLESHATQRDLAPKFRDPKIQRPFGPVTQDFFWAQRALLFYSRNTVLFFPSLFRCRISPGTSSG